MEVVSSNDPEEILKEPTSPGPEGEIIDSTPLPDTTTRIVNPGGSDEAREKHKESRIQTLKKLVTGKTKSKNEEKEKQEPSEKKEEKTRPSRELRKSLSRVFSVSSSSIGRVWNSLSATRIQHEEGSGPSKTLGRSFGQKTKTEESKHSFDTEGKSQTLGRRFSSTFRNAFGRSKES